MIILFLFSGGFPILFLFDKYIPKNHFISAISSKAKPAASGGGVDGDDTPRFGAVGVDSQTRFRWGLACKARCAALAYAGAGLRE